MGFEDRVITVEEPENWSVYIYGEPGCGKTVLAAQSPRPLILDCEKSRKSLRNHPELLNVPIVPITSYRQVTEVLQAILKGDPFFDEIETIVIDTYSRLQQLQLREELKDAIKKDANRHPWLPSQAEYNINNKRLEDLIVNFVNRSGKNLILLGHVKEVQSDEGSTILIRPNNSETTVGNVIQLVDAMFYMTSNTDSKGVTTRKLQTLPNRKTKAKNRFGKLPPILEDPEFDVLVKAFN